MGRSRDAIASKKWDTPILHHFGLNFMNFEDFLKDFAIQGSGIDLNI